MWNIELIKRVQAILEEFASCAGRFSELSPTGQSACELANALHMRLAHLLHELETGRQELPAAQNGFPLGSLLHALGALADDGAVGRTLSPTNQKMLTEMLGQIKSASLAEQGLRKKDAALFLKHSADTDLAIDEQNRIDALAAKKDGK